MANPSKTCGLKGYYVPWRQLARPLNWEQIFGGPAPVHLEIGFGNGEYLARCAKADPESHYVGIEMTWGSIKRASGFGRRDGLQNMRVIWEDAKAALAWGFSSRCLSSITALYPCPWPKKRHAKFRLFKPDFIRLCNDRLVDGGSLIVVTDSAPYKDEILEQNQAEETGMEITCETIPASFQTKYEKKWQGEGQAEFYRLRFQKDNHIPYQNPETLEMKHHLASKFDPENFHPPDEKTPYSVQFKQFVFDPKQEIALLEVHTHEETVEQHFFIRIKRQENGWKIHPAGAAALLPIPSAQRALDIVKEAAEK